MRKESMQSSHRLDCPAHRLESGPIDSLWVHRLEFCPIDSNLYTLDSKKHKKIWNYNAQIKKICEVQQREVKVITCIPSNSYRLDCLVHRLDCLVHRLDCLVHRLDCLVHRLEFGSIDSVCHSICKTHRITRVWLNIYAKCRNLAESGHLCCPGIPYHYSHKTNGAIKPL